MLDEIARELSRCSHCGLIGARDSIRASDHEPWCAEVGLNQLRFGRQGPVAHSLGKPSASSPVDTKKKRPSDVSPP